MLRPANPAPESQAFVRVRGAREHNLKNIDVDIPRNALVVFSGISGSGKSSLAFSTLYAEAQRRYFESVAPYARRLIDQVGVPDVDSIDGLPPAVALQQQRGTPSVRSSVGTVTMLSSLVRIIYSRAGHYPARQRMLYAEDFSPNTPQGACPNCKGLGRVYDVPENLMVPDNSLTIRERAIASWPRAWHGQNLRDILVSLGYDVDKRWRELPKKERNFILYTQDQPTAPVYAGFTPAETRYAIRSKTEPSYQGTFIGARKYILDTFAATQSAQMKKRVSRFMTGTDCPVCDGKRLKPEALSVTFAGLDIGEFSRLPLSQLLEVLRPIAAGHLEEMASKNTSLSPAVLARQAKNRAAAGLPMHGSAPNVRRTDSQSEEKRIAAQRIAADLVERIFTLTDLGLGYLALDRSTPTLSAGELQRLRLATQIRSNLFGVIYVLDEPSAGLHPADREALFAALAQLKRSGNSIFVVEHDLEVMRRADWLIDVGPDAGLQGGEILYSGPPAGLSKISASRTAPYLFPAHGGTPRRPRSPLSWLVLEGITRNNLRKLNVSFPLGVFTAVTGVSGSGKSTLVSKALVDLATAALGMVPVATDAEADALHTGTDRTLGKISDGMAGIKRLVMIDQKPIGRTPRSNLATYTGLFDQVRRLFSGTRSAHAKGFDAGQFSFNVAKGRCPTCEGEGFVSVELVFMPSVYAPCPVCHGKRYNEATLKILYQDKSIADVLDMSVENAANFFAHDTIVSRSLSMLLDIGLGYLRLGQPATELSGGEAQRIKLATELQRSQRGNTLYVLDEPTTGLHPFDVDKLMLHLHNLVDAGNTVIVVEHNIRVIAASDWIIDMGPGGGDDGGLIVVAGPPESVAECEQSRTAPFLRAHYQVKR